MPRNVRSTATKVGEDVTDKAGWMYADLFLALMVIFLATISFVPDFRQSPNTGSSSADTGVASSTMNQGANQTYTTFDPKKLQSDIAAYRKENGLPTSSAVVYVQVIGGYDAATQGVNAGTLTAVNFSLKMKAALPDIFSTATFKIDTNPQLPANTVALRFVFAG